NDGFPANLNEGEISCRCEPGEDTITELSLTREKYLKGDIESSNPYFNLVFEILPWHIVNVLAAEFL
ncbi:hypothetical protein A2U01_0081376, partial [Trifolium medium]|nr:hypothetical protein [Trifolium medium]